MFRELKREDRGIWCTLADEFYHSSGVLHPIPSIHYERTFDALMEGSPYLEAFLVEWHGEPVGYGQVSFTYSMEAGGLVVWLEELYIRPTYQGRGIGAKYFEFVHERYKDKAARFRLEIEPSNAGAERLYKRMGYEHLPYKQMIIDRAHV